MKLLFPAGLLVLATVTVAQPPTPVTPPAPSDCTPDHPCTAVTDATGHTIVTPINDGVISAPGADSGRPMQGAHDKFMHTFEGPEILSLEETARRYFQEIAYFDSRNEALDQPMNPKNLLRDRDGLSEAEASEVIAVAREANAPTTPQARQAGIEREAALLHSQCDALNRAGTADAQLAALQAADADDVKRDIQAGKSLLAQLSPGTRARVMEVLAEQRKKITVVRRDWKHLRDERPEALEMYRAAKCANAN